MTTPAADARDNLTQADAEARAARVRHCDYTIGLQLTRGAATYRGEATLRFDATGPGDIFLDFRGKTIEVLEVNGANVEPRWDGFRLWLPGEAIAASNTVRVVYENDYDHEGDGFH